MSPSDFETSIQNQINNHRKYCNREPNLLIIPIDMQLMIYGHFPGQASISDDKLHELFDLPVVFGDNDEPIVACTLLPGLGINT